MAYFSRIKWGLNMRQGVSFSYSLFSDELRPINLLGIIASRQFIFSVFQIRSNCCGDSYRYVASVSVASCHWFNGIAAPCIWGLTTNNHDGIIKWNNFSSYWPFVRGIHWSTGNSPHKGQWRGALMFSVICAWAKHWVNNRDAADLRRHRTHYDVTVVYAQALVDKEAQLSLDIRRKWLICSISWARFTAWTNNHTQLNVGWNYWSIPKRQWKGPLVNRRPKITPNLSD